MAEIVLAFSNCGKYRAMKAENLVIVHKKTLLQQIIFLKKRKKFLRFFLLIEIMPLLLPSV